MPPAAIEIFSISKSFNESRGHLDPAVKNISFRVSLGEVYGLLGLNGAGKTTLLRMLATLAAPSGGTARIMGHDILSDPAGVRASIGFLGPNTGLYARFTARENLALFGRLQGLSAQDFQHRIAQLADDFEMGDFIDRRCNELSTGMRQKVTIARAIVHDPPVLILDEPTAGLDVLGSSIVMRFIRDSKNRGKTVIMSTHIMSEIDGICDRVGLLDQGVIMAEGTPAALRDRATEQDFGKLILRLISEGVRP
jgi:sodium transport system ATP-binding protein